MATAPLPAAGQLDTRTPVEKVLQNDHLAVQITNCIPIVFIRHYILSNVANAPGGYKHQLLHSDSKLYRNQWLTQRLANRVPALEPALAEIRRVGAGKMVKQRRLALINSIENKHEPAIKTFLDDLFAGRININSCSGCLCFPNPPFKDGSHKFCRNCTPLWLEYSGKYISFAQLANVGLHVHARYEPASFQVQGPFVGQDLPYVPLPTAQALATRIHGKSLKELLEGTHGLSWQQRCRNLAIDQSTQARRYHGVVSEQGAQSRRDIMAMIYRNRFDIFGLTVIGRAELSSLLQLDMDDMHHLKMLTRIANGQDVPATFLGITSLASVIKQADSLEKECIRLIIRRIDEDINASTRLAIRSIANTIGHARRQNFSEHWILRTVIGPVRVAFLVAFRHALATGELPWLEYVRLIKQVPLPQGVPPLVQRLCSDMVPVMHALLDSMLTQIGGLDDLSLAKLFIHLAVASSIRSVAKDHWFNWQKRKFLSTRFFYLCDNDDTKLIKKNLSTQLFSYTIQDESAPFPPFDLQNITPSGNIAVYRFPEL